MEYQFPGQRLGLSFLIGGTESRKLDHQKIPNTRKYLLVRTNTKASTCIQDPASPNCWQLTVQDGLPKPQARQKHKPNHQQTRFPLTPQNIPPHTVLAIKGKKKKSPPSNRKQEQVNPNTKSKQTTGPALPTDGRNQMEEGI